MTLHVPGDLIEVSTPAFSYASIFLQPARRFGMNLNGVIDYHGSRYGIVVGQPDLIMSDGDPGPVYILFPTRVGWFMDSRVKRNVECFVP